MELIEVPISTEYIKLDQLLKLTGIAETGGHAKEIVLEGVCIVNGEVCTQRGKKLYHGSVVKLDNYRIEIYKEDQSEDHIIIV